MKKISRVFFLVMFSFSFLSCDLFSSTQLKLSTPENFRVEGNIAKWSIVDGSSGYVISIDGDEYPTETNSLNLSESITEEGTYLLKVKAKGDGIQTISSDFCEEISFDFISPAPADNVRYGTTKRDDMNNPAFPVMETFRDENYYYYAFYLGSINHVPAQEEYEVYQYQGYDYSKMISTTTTTSSTVERLVSSAISACLSANISATLKSSTELKVDVVGYGSVKEKIEVGISSSIGSSLTESASESYSSAETYSITNAETTNFSFDSSSPQGWYRYVLMVDIDVFGVLIYDFSSGDFYLQTYERVASHYWSLDYSTTSRFDDNQYGTLPFDLSETEISSLIQNIPSCYLEDSGGDDPEISYGATFVSTSFSAYVWCEGSNLGQATFTVQGIQVKYEGKYYVYGNAAYSGTLGGNRFNDVASIHLKTSTRNILMGGIFHWRGSKSDINECGVSGWDRTAGMNSSDVSFLVEDPTKDFPANEAMILSISEICVEYEGVPSSTDGVPEIITTQFSTDFYSEESKNGSMTFDVIGIKVKYEDSYFVYGNAFYSGSSGGSRFNDVAYVSLRSSTENILLGGTMVWSGSYGDNNESGVAGFNKDGGYNSPIISFLIENPTKDFAGNESVKITISGICVEIESIEDTSFVPEMVSTAFSASVYCESAFEGTAKFDVIGFRVDKDGKQFVYGNAFHSGTTGGNRFNDVNRLSLQNTTKEVLLGGTLYWRGSLDDHNESGVAGYSNSESSGYDVSYLQEDPNEDFAGNETVIISITGICVEN